MTQLEMKPNICSADVETIQSVFHQKDISNNTFVEGLKQECETKIWTVFCDAESRIVPTKTYRLYKRRFTNLLLLCLMSLFNGMMFLQYSAVSNITMCYYQVSLISVDWLSMNTYLLFLLLFIPSMAYSQKYGLRITVVTSALLTLIGAVIQCFGQNRDGYVIALISQFFGAAGSMFFLPIPSKLATTWFGRNEVSRASATAVIGDKLGLALGLLFTPLMVPNDCNDLELVRHGKVVVAYYLAGCNVVVFLLIIVGFEDKPPTPPSQAETGKANILVDFKKSFSKVVKDTNFLLLLLCRGLITGLYLSFSTVLNTEILMMFPNTGKEIGFLGLVLTCSGIIGLFAIGNVMDYTHKFKETSAAVCVFSLLAMVAFTGFLYLERLWLVFVVISILGFFLVSYYVVGFEFAVELTYPQPEEITGNLLVASGMALAILLTLVASYLIEVYGLLSANLFFCGILSLCCITTVFIKPKYLRTEENANKYQRINLQLGNEHYTINSNQLFFTIFKCRMGYHFQL